MCIDTNVIVNLIAGDDSASSAAIAALETCARRGPMVVAAPVFAELLAFRGWAIDDVFSFLSQTKIDIDWELDRDIWVRAGNAYGVYAERRTKKKQDVPRRLLADFVIGAHAVAVGAIVTSDDAFYRTNFPALKVIAP